MLRMLSCCSEAKGHLCIKVSSITVEELSESVPTLRTILAAISMLANVLNGSSLKH